MYCTYLLVVSLYILSDFTLAHLARPVQLCSVRK